MLLSFIYWVVKKVLDIFPEKIFSLYIVECALSQKSVRIGSRKDAIRYDCSTVTKAASSSREPIILDVPFFSEYTSGNMYTMVYQGAFII